jgi:uncharacterized membrane protein
MPNDPSVTASSTARACSRRIRQKRIWQFVVLAACIALASGLFVTCPADASPQYQVQELEPVPSLFTFTVPRDIADSRQAVGSSFVYEGTELNRHATVWNEDGTHTDIGIPSEWSEAYGVSETGFIAGEQNIGTTPMGALWSGGQRQTLVPLPGEPACRAYGVDAAGIAYGASIITSTDTKAVRWIDGVPEILPGANAQSWAFAASDGGFAVGRRDNLTGRQAMLWYQDTFTVLPDLGEAFASATSVSSNGTVCGGSINASGAIVAVIWKPGTRDISVLPEPDFGIFSNVWAVNDQAIAVGERCLDIDCASTRALVWIGNTVYDLNDLVPEGSGWTLASATGINNLGEIVGTGFRSGFQGQRGFRLTPDVTSVASGSASSVRLRVAPNPLRAAGEITWTSRTPTPAVLEVFDVAGRRIAHREFPSPTNSTKRASWIDLFGGNPPAAGIYFVQLRQGGAATERTRVVVIR